MDSISFRIRGMCCGEEAAILKRVLAPLVGGEANLTFDLLAAKMTVRSCPPEVTETDLRAAVAATGMEALPWAEGCSTGVCPVEEGWWERHGHFFSCLASGFLILLGLVADAYHRGSILAALLVDSDSPEGFTLEVILIYGTAALAGGWFVLPRAWYALRTMRPDMNLLMVVAVAGAMGLRQWFEAASVSFLFSLALLLESWSVGRARAAIKALMAVSPATARFLCPVDGDIEEKPIDEIPVGSTVLVRPGERIPLDGVISRGVTTVNQAPITGESLPVPRQAGDEVYAGTINGESSIEVQTTKPATDTALAHIIHMVEDAQSRRAAVEQWVDRFARVYTPIMMLLSLLVATIPPLLWGEIWGTWFYQALVVLVIACPCSLVISTPVSIVAGLTAAARNGVLIKGGVHLEAPAHLRGIAFDKTGTLTHGRPEVKTILPMDDHSEEEILARAAALESHSTHPFARAILSLAQARDLEVTPVDRFTVLPGQGALGVIKNKTYWVGSHRFLEQWNHESTELHNAANSLEEAGHSLVILWCEDHVCGLLSLADSVRPEARNAIQALKHLGVGELVMLTGDNRRTAGEIANFLGIDTFHADLLPEDKVSVVAEMRKSLGPIAMVGDGVNDAPAMASASVSIAMGAIGSDAAIETADIALMADDLTKLPWLIRHSRRTLRVIKENVVISLLVKVSFIGLAFAGLATLWGAIAADMGASLLVIFNGLRLLHAGGRG